MHQTTAMALGIEYHRIDVRVPPVGGGFGGKTEQTRFVVGPTAVAAYTTKKPVRLAVPREEDTSMIGKRHAYYGQYQIAVDRGGLGRKTKASFADFRPRCGATAALFTIARTSSPTASNSAPTMPTRSAISKTRSTSAARTKRRAPPSELSATCRPKPFWRMRLTTRPSRSDMLPEELREKNLYERGDVTPFGQALSDCYIREVWSFLKEKCQYDEKRPSGRRVQSRTTGGASAGWPDPGQVRLRLQPGAA